MRILLIVLASAFLWSCDDKPADKPAVEPKAQVAPELEELNARIAEDPNDIQAYIDRAKYYKSIFDFESAEGDLSRGFRIDSTNAELYNILGDIQYFKEDVKSARDNFDLCISYDSLNTECLLKKAEIEMLLRNYGPAVTLINQALRVDQFIPQAYFMKGMMYKETGDSALSASSFHTTIELDPDHFDAYIQLGLLYAGAGDDLALEFYNSAIEKQPNSTEARYNKAMFLQEHSNGDVGKLQLALQTYDQIHAIDPSMAASSYNKGYIYKELLEYPDSALIEFSLAIDKYPAYHQAYYSRGITFEMMGDLQSALKDLDQALLIQPDYTPAALAKGRVLDQM
jgi:tetratricopeptide (TPR) repeat protein